MVKRGQFGMWCFGRDDPEGFGLSTWKKEVVLGSGGGRGGEQVGSLGKSVCPSVLDSPLIQRPIRCLSRNSAELGAA